MPKLSPSPRALLLLPLASLLLACGGSEGGTSARTAADSVELAAMEAEYPDTVYLRATEARLESFRNVQSVQVAATPLVPCPGGTGEQVRRRIGTAGGSITLPESGHILTIQSGSLDRDYDFVLRDVPAANFLVVSATPHGVQFSIPATITLNFRRCKGVDPSRLVVARLKSGAPGDDVGGTVDSTTISAPISRLSQYALAEP